MYVERFEKATCKITDAPKVYFEKQGLVSVYIHSNMSHLGRIALLSKIIKKLLLNLKKQDRNHYDQLG
jgi:hypothetical protein